MESSQGAWERHKETLRALYIDQRKSLKQVYKIMRDDESQLEEKLRDFGFVKNLHTREWDIVCRRITKRKADGMDSDVYISGVLQPPKKIRKKMAKYGKQCEGDVRAPSEMLPTGVTIKTPPVRSGSLFEDNDDAFGVEMSSPTVFLSQEQPHGTVERNLEASTMAGQTGAHNSNETVICSVPRSGVAEVPRTTEIEDETVEAVFFNGNIVSETRPPQALPSPRMSYSSPRSRSVSPFEWNLWLHSGPPSPGRAFELAFAEYEDNGDVNLFLSAGQDPLIRRTSAAFLLDLPVTKFRILMRGLEKRGPFSQERETILATRQREQFIYSTIPLAVVGPNYTELELRSRVESFVQVLFPEVFEGELVMLVRQLLDPTFRCSLAQLLEIPIFILANNHFGYYEKGRQFLDLFLKVDDTTELLRFLFCLNSPYIQAFINMLISTAAHYGDVNAFNLLVSRVTDGNWLHEGRRWQRYLRIALEGNEIHLAKTLLGYVSGKPSDPNRNSIAPSLLIAGETLEELLALSIGSISSEAVDLILGNAPIYVNQSTMDSALSRAAIFHKRSGPSEDQEEWTEVEKIMIILVKNGANVDEKTSQAPHHHTSTMVFSHLDSIYFISKKLYLALCPFSRRIKSSITTGGILDAASTGSQGIREYLSRPGWDNKIMEDAELEGALVRAIQFGSSDFTDEILALLDWGVDPNTSTYTNAGGDPVFKLTKWVWPFSLPVIRSLIDGGVNFNQPGVLCGAASSGRIDVISCLLEEGRVDIRKFGPKAFGEAALINNVAICGLLLCKGLPIDYNGPDGAPLYSAAKYGRIDFVQYLLQEGAPINAKSTKSNKTALEIAVEYGHLEVTKAILDCDSTLLQNYALLELSSETHPKMFEFLLERGAPINGPDISSGTRWRNWQPILTNLILCNANQKLIELALNAGASLNQLGAGYFARTPLQACAELGRLEIAKILVEKGSDVNGAYGDDNGRTALQAATSQSDPSTAWELVQFLLDKGADIHAPASRWGGITALQGAAARGHIKIAVVLLERGADVNAPRAENIGRTAVEAAAEHGRLDMVQILLNAGAKGQPEEDGFRKPIELAEGEGHFAVADLLRAHEKNLREGEPST